MSTVVFYYMTGCPWCVKFYDEWDKFVVMANKNGINAQKIERAQMNKQPLIGGQIQGFPTIRVKNAKGDVFDYGGNRTANDLMAFVKEHSQQMGGGVKSAEKQQLGGGVKSTEKQQIGGKYKNALRQLYTYKINKYSEKLQKLNNQ